MEAKGDEEKRVVDDDASNENIDKKDNKDDKNGEKDQVKEQTSLVINNNLQNLISATNVYMHGSNVTFFIRKKTECRNWETQ